MCILQGFPTTLAKSATAFPFGLWFANADTLYVADEGNGTNTYSTATGTYTAAAAQTTAGLEVGVQRTSWTLAYTLTAGPNLGTPYTVRGLSGRGQRCHRAALGAGHRRPAQHHRPVNGDCHGTIWAVTSTVSGNGDQGADPNKLVAITDPLAATAARPASSS